jgi:diguanylate cyclase (GGDEF)-like protein
MTVKTTQRDEESRLAELRSIGILDTQAEERYDRFTRLAKRAFNVPFAMLSLVDEKREWFKSRQGMEETELPREGSFSTEAIKQDKVMVIQDATRDPRFSKLARESGIKFYAGCPIKTHRNYRIGTLCIADTTPRNFTPEDHACLQDLARLIEEEIAVQSIANIDDLTSLFNRRGFLGIGQHTISVCKRMRRPATMMYFDLDGFKEVNDQYGHAEGDRALKNISTLLLSAFRNSDVVARVGGDEFCVLLTGTDTAHIERPLENLAASVELQNNATPYDIAYSVGVVEYDDGHESISDLMEEADTQMYDDKRTRKSQIGLSA